MKNSKIIDKQEIINRLGLQRQSPEVQKQLIDKFLKVLNGRVSQTLSESLSEQQIAEFNSLLDGSDDNDAQLSDWVNKNVPHQVQTVKEEYDLLLNQMAQDISSINDDNS
jgi:succinate dehydrogenase flavin-adding protein (antitoxin of CptAB toxin-antitoxin module)